MATSGTSNIPNMSNMPDVKDAQLVDVGAQLRGLPIDVLVGAPLVAACNAQKKLAYAVSDFIQDVGLQSQTKGSTGTQSARKINFSMTRPVTQADGTISEEKVDLSVPLLAIVPIPNLQVSDVTVDFEFQVQSQVTTTTGAAASVQGDLTTGTSNTTAHQDDDNENDTTNTSNTNNFHIHGEVSCHKEQTRSSDNSAKYSIHIGAKQQPPSEGLMKVLDILNSACQPRAITPVAGAGGTPAAGGTARPPTAQTQAAAPAAKQ